MWLASWFYYRKSFDFTESLKMPPGPAEFHRITDISRDAPSCTYEWGHLRPIHGLESGRWKWPLDKQKKSKRKLRDRNSGHSRQLSQVAAASFTCRVLEGEKTALTQMTRGPPCQNVQAALCSPVTSCDQAATSFHMLPRDHVRWPVRQVPAFILINSSQGDSDSKPCHEPALLL